MHYKVESVTFKLDNQGLHVRESRPTSDRPLKPEISLVLSRTLLVDSSIVFSDSGSY